MPEEIKEKKEYNKLYEQLVCQADDDFDQMVGMLAYGEYKWKKNMFFARYFKKHGKKPDEAAIDNFMLEYREEETRCQLLEDARNRLYLFAESYVDEKRDEMISKAKDTEVVRTVRQSTALWKGLLLSIGGALIYSLIVAGITFSITILSPESPVAVFIKSLLL